MINDKIASLHSLFPASDIRREYIHQHDISSSDIRALCGQEKISGIWFPTA